MLVGAVARVVLVLRVTGWVSGGWMVISFVYVLLGSLKNMEALLQLKASLGLGQCIQVVLPVPRKSYGGQG